MATVTVNTLDATFGQYVDSLTDNGDGTGTLNTSNVPFVTLDYQALFGTAATSGTYVDTADPSPKQMTLNVDNTNIQIGVTVQCTAEFDQQIWFNGTVVARNNTIPSVTVVPNQTSFFHEGGSGWTIQVTSLNTPGIEADISASAIVPSGVGPFTFSVSTGKFFPADGSVLIKALANPAVTIFGRIASYSGTSLLVGKVSDTSIDTSSYSAWNVSTIDSSPINNNTLGLSTTTLTFGNSTGQLYVGDTVTVNTDANKLFTTGSYIIVTALAGEDQFFRGTAQSYNSTGVLSLFITDVGSNATGSYSSWSVNAQDGPNISTQLVATSTTSLNAISALTKSLTTQTGLPISPGSLIYLNPTSESKSYIFGQVVSYNSGTGALVINWLDGFSASGINTYSSWNLFLISGSLNGQAKANPLGSNGLSLIIGSPTLGSSVSTGLAFFDATSPISSGGTIETRFLGSSTYTTILSTNMNGTSRNISYSGDLSITANSTLSGFNSGDQFTSIAGPSVLGKSGTTTGIAVVITGTANQILQVGSNGTSLAFTTLSIATSSITGIISVPNGGTGTSSITAHGAVIGNGTSAVSVATVSTSGFALISNGTASDPTFQQITTGFLSGIISVPNGGTGTSALTAGQIILGNGTSAVNVTSLVSVSLGGTGTTTLTANGVLLGNGTSSVGIAVIGASGTVLASNGTSSAPTFQTISAGLSAASQAQMEAATSTAVAVTPGLQVNHPLMPKARGYYTLTSSSVTGNISAVNTTSDVITWSASHTLNTGDLIVPLAGTWPSPLALTQSWYVNPLGTTTTFATYTSLSNANNDTARVNLTTAGSATRTMNKWTVTNVDSFGMATTGSLTFTNATATVLPAFTVATAFSSSSWQPQLSVYGTAVNLSFNPPTLTTTTATASIPGETWDAMVNSNFSFVGYGDQ